MAFFSKTTNEMKKWLDRSVCSAVIAAAGSSCRMGGEDKQFAEIHGVPVLAHTLTAFQNCRLIDEIVVVARDDELEHVRDICEEYKVRKVTWVVAGGETRLDSVINGVFAVSRNATHIAIHDGARPCVTSDIIELTVTAARKYHAAAPAIPLSSTVKEAKNGVVLRTVEREGLFEVQTPQIFTADIIKAALTKVQKKALTVTDDCMAVEQLGLPVHLTEGSRYNIKLTTREDLFLAEAILGAGGDAQ